MSTPEAPRPAPAEQPPERGRTTGARRRISAWLKAQQAAWRAAWERTRSSTDWHFFVGAMRLLWDYRRFSIPSMALTIFQEIAALWPARLLGQFVDRLQTGDLGNVVWLFFGASVLYPLVLRTNVIVSNRMFYAMELEKRVEWTARVGKSGQCAGDAEKAGTAIIRIVNGVSAMAHLAFYTVRSVAPIFVKVIAVSSALLAYSRTLGLVYMGSLVIPVVMTIRYNKRVRALRDRQYGLASEVTGTAVKALAEHENPEPRARFLDVMVDRRRVLFGLLARSQLANFFRTAVLTGSQFAVVFLALAMRHDLGLTPGDFTTIVGYTGQVAAAVLGAASVYDTIVDLTRAYTVYVQAHGE